MGGFLILQNIAMLTNKNTIIIIVSAIILLSCSKENNTIIDNPDPVPPVVDIEIPKENSLGVLLNKKGVFDGFYLFTPSKSTETYLINNCGEVINKWSSEYKSGKSVYLLENGNLLRAGEILNQNIKIGGIGGVIELFDWDGNIIWSYIYSSEQFSHHHDAIPLPNGNLLLLIATRKTYDEAISAGRDPNTMIDGELYNEQIIEVEMIGNDQINIVWEWNIWDHLIQDFDMTKDNYGVIEDNPQLLNINFVGRSADKADWLHANSIQYNSTLDEIIISFQGTSEIFIIDHSTTTEQAASHAGGNKNKGGDILYRWGNPISYNHGTEDDRTLWGQHYPHWIPDSYPDGGKILIFNNGLERIGDFSTVNIISPPKTSTGDYIINPGEAFAPQVAEWEYKADMFFSEIISSAQRLPNGNTLICEGTKGRFFEINENKNIVWEYINPDSGSGILSQGDLALDNAVFRVFKYSKEYPAFNNKDLIPQNPIELEFNIGNCQ